MPAPKGEGKKKSSKKEAIIQEQQRLVEEAQRAEEAELQRVASEERKAKEEAAARAEAVQRAVDEEKQRLLHQARRDHRYVHRQRRLLAQLYLRLSAAAEWTKYIECDPLPDVAREAELNTFLSLWRDSPAFSNTPHALLSSVILSCSTAHSIVHSLTAQHSLAREDHDLPLQAFLTRHSTTLHHLTHSKLDALTSAYLAHSDQYLDAAHTLSLSHHSPHVDYALWVHGSAKHGRVKRIEWGEVGVVIDLPVALQQSRIAIRCVRTTYDSISGGGEDAWGEGFEEVGREGETGGEREERLRSREMRRVLRPPHHFVSVGGIISIEQLALPPPPKQAKGWAMRELAHATPSLTPILYPNDDPPSTTTSSAPSHIPVPASAAATQSNAPLRVSLTIPASIYLPHPTPHFGWYDTATHAWRQDGVTLLSYDPSTRHTQLALSTLHPFALIQPRALDFPYRQWHLHTEGGEGECQLLLKGSRYDLTLSITAGLARLLHPTHSLLSAVNEQPAPPGHLLLRMQQLGVNVMPTEEDGEYCRKPRKREEMVASLHGHIAQVVGSFDVGGMEMNGGRGERVAMMRVRLSRTSTDLARSLDKRREWETRRSQDPWWQADQAEVTRRSKVHDEEVKEATSPTPEEEEDDPDLQSDEQRRAAAERRAKAEAKAAEEAERREREERERKAAAPQLDPAETAEQRRERAYAWHTVMVTLTDVEGDEVVMEEGDGVGGGGGGEDGGEDALPYGTIPEHVWGGHHLLKFALVKGMTNGQVDLTVLAGQEAHVSLRRCLWAYWKGLVGEGVGVEGINLAAALDLSEEVEGELSFLPVPQHRLHHQQTVRQILNLTQPFRFF